MKLNENKTMIGVIAIVLVLFAVTVFFYNQTLNNLAATSCTDMNSCPHEKIVETQNIIIAALLIVIVIMAGWLIYSAYSKKDEKGSAPDAASREKQKPRKVDASSLDDEEKKILSFLQQRKGSVFQSEIRVRTGFSKVKVSRLLDKMEQKNIIERKRRGMANLVVLR